MGHAKKNHVGVDLGGVIVSPGRISDIAKASNKITLAKPMSGAFEGVHKLVSHLNGNVRIISKAGPETEELSMKWLVYHDFFNATGMAKKNVHFCRKRLQKRDLCKQYGITHFIDDRIHLMQILKGHVDHLYLFGPKEGKSNLRKWVNLVESWPELLKTLNFFESY